MKNSQYHCIAYHLHLPLRISDMIVRMKIIFLNTFHSGVAQELRAYIEKHIATTDIFCFQEAPKEDRVTYEDLFAEFEVHTAHKGDEPSNRYGNTTYIRKSVEVKKTDTLFEVDKDGIKLGLTTVFTVEVQGKLLMFCNVHGIPIPGHKLDTPARLLQSQAILDAISGDAIIIGGDFNLLPETESVQVFAEHGYRNLIADFDIKTTRNRLTFERFPDNIQLYADYAFTSPAIKVTDFVVPGDVVSDHQPLELTFEL